MGIDNGIYLKRNKREKNYEGNVVSGKLIVIEGLDGSGKATQANMLYKALSEHNVSVRKVSFPDYASASSALVKMYLNGEFGMHPDDVNAYAASSFYAVDRYASYKTGWKTFMDSGGIVIADRYTTSNAVHQCSKLSKDQWDTYLDWLFEYEYKLLGIPEPTLVIYLHVDPEVSQNLMTGRYAGHEEKKDIHEKDLGYLRRSQEAADYCVKKFGWKLIECCRGKEMRNVESIHTDVMHAIENAL
ncbi:MAG: deoxynucleoside kinase [Rikenellaceae bacterium]|nr:deoxynucleoside kinase [Rikenellaceae bacterium]